jgi:HEAT repeat protein
MRTVQLCLGALALAISSLSIPAAELKLPRDGWASWEVPAVDKAPASCCFNHWDPGQRSVVTCQLDTSNLNMYSGGEATTDKLRVYARFAGGKLERLKSLSASCPVKAGSTIHDLGSVEADDSARWLASHVKQEGTGGKKNAGEHVLAALALHRGNLARDELIGFARNDSRIETRKDALFWLSQSRGEEGAEITSSVMFSDKEPEVRKHGAFALAQSESSRVAPDLIRLGNSDKVADVRSQAWFWLAQSGAVEAESAISVAIRKEPDEDVREKAIFALSQLPDERSAKALIAVAEDQSLSREQRKKAVFWLSQSDSNDAVVYLDKVMARAAH